MEDKRKKVVFIINPKSGVFNKTNWIAMATRMLAKDFDLEFKYTTHRGHACELAQQAVSEHADVVAAVGGDGTVNEIASSLMGTDTALAILPLGSGNGLARDLGIFTLLPFNSLLTIKRFKVKQIDCGIANDVPFFCTCGIGFDARVSYEIIQRNKRGFWMYAILCMRNFFSYKPIDCEISANGKTETRQIFMLNCANIRQFGFNAYIAPNADLQDGKLNVTIVKPFSFWWVPRFVAALFTKRIDYFKKYVETFECEEIVLKFPPKTPFHCDGDYCPMPNDLHVKVVKQALKVLVP